PSTPYTITALLGTTRNSTGGSNPPVAGIGWYDGTAKLHGIVYENNVSTGLITVRRYTNVTPLSSADFGSLNNLFSHPIWLQIKGDGTNVWFGFSQDGVNFLVAVSVAKASGFLGATGYSNVIFYVNPGVPANSLAALLSWTKT